MAYTSPVTGPMRTRQRLRGVLFSFLRRSRCQIRRQTLQSISLGSNCGQLGLRGCFWNALRGFTSKHFPHCLCVSSRKCFAWIRAWPNTDVICRFSSALFAGLPSMWWTISERFKGRPSACCSTQRCSPMAFPLIDSSRCPLGNVLPFPGGTTYGGGLGSPRRFQRCQCRLHHPRAIAVRPQPSQEHIEGVCFIGVY